jgi:hypothetical protein
MIDPAAFGQRVTSFVADADPLTEASNRLALIVASNQPFYPLYIKWMTGEISPLLALTFVSTPLFIASPWVARRLPGVGRLWFPAVGAINTFFCTAIFGVASGVELFLVPCLIIATLSCRARERRALLACIAMIVGMFILLHGHYGPALFEVEPARLAALNALNSYSALFLSVISIWLLGRPRFKNLTVIR